MRFYSETPGGERRYIAAQPDRGGSPHLAIKTALDDKMFSGTWVYLDKEHALKLAAQILEIASRMVE